MVARYYMRIGADDLAARPPEALLAAVEAHLDAGRRRARLETVVAITPPAGEPARSQLLIVTNDMPFLVDSVGLALLRRRVAVHLIVHPIFTVERDATGELRALVEGMTAADPTTLAESWMRFEIEAMPEAAARDALRADVLEVIEDVRAVVGDWEPMRERLRAAIAEVERLRAYLPVPADELDEQLAFLRWLDDHHFTYVGFSAFDLNTTPQGDELVLQAESELGIFRRRVLPPRIALPAHVRTLVRQPDLLLLTKSVLPSTVHRPARLDYVGIRRFDASGAVVGAWQFHGLYAASAYTTRPCEIPLLRRKLEQVIAHAAFTPDSHDGRNLEHILATLPREELIQADARTLFETATGILELQGRQRLRAFLRPDPTGRFVSALVVLPRDRYDTRLRQRMQALLMAHLDGVESQFTVQFSEPATAQVHIVVWLREGPPPAFDARTIEARLSEAMQSWSDRLRAALVEALGEPQGLALHARYAEAFPDGYREDWPAATAVDDIQRLEAINAHHPFALRLYRLDSAPAAALHFRLAGRGEALPLSTLLPLLDHLGLRVLRAEPYEIMPRSSPPFWLVDFEVELVPAIDEAWLMQRQHLFYQAFERVATGEAEDDTFNTLVLAAGLNWREVTLLRAYCRYFLQAGIPFSQPYIGAALLRNPAVTCQWVELFHRRFDPARVAAEAEFAQAVAACERAIDKVASLDDDRILRRYLHTLVATLRTNFYRRSPEGRYRAFVAFKFDGRRVPELPLPRPRFEIFVHAPHVEGVHLRAGHVARGGIRWSERREDFRTEVLGLMKAQIVKNALIVPTGAKGGFVARGLPSGASGVDAQREVMRCYADFIRGLLDLTDNRDGETVQPPTDIVRHDDDDPYLVVAADKGTAGFSDTANRIAAEYGFWLGDAFASGGSHGYDHKRMGITARGAWESVKRHFRELGRDIQRTPFTVVGIGDMSGDVFGNGMLQSREIRLIAAFNHQHIFIDPTPDPETSFAERERLFRQPRSTWMDYDPTLISPGGGVYPRTVKHIELSEAAREALGIETTGTPLTPADLIRAILRAPVDLLWNGGIGTYVKASAETHAEVGDRANDALRIDAAELRCKVVGEGGNLGLTQRARVEFALRGGLVNADAIDNSGGVDCSDHEVNLKILLDQCVRGGELTFERRNALLTAMTEEVATLVVRDNYAQTQAISIAAQHARYFHYDHRHLIVTLEREGRLDRTLDALPSEAEFAHREAAGIGLTRPEIAVLLAHAKLRLTAALNAAPGFADTPAAQRALVAYFPPTLRAAFPSALTRHPLRREIMATQVANAVVNRMGSTFLTRMEEETDASPQHITAALLAAEEIYQADALWCAIEVLDNQLDARLQNALWFEIRRFLDRATRWLLREHPEAVDPDDIAARYRPTAEAVFPLLPEALQGEARGSAMRAAARWIEQGVPDAIATRVAHLSGWLTALDIADVARSNGATIAEVTQLYHELDARLALHWLGEQLRALSRDTPWHRRARTALREDLGHAHREIAEALLHAGSERDVPRFEVWARQRPAALSRYQVMLKDLMQASATDLAMLTVVVRALRELATRNASTTVGGD